MRKNFWAILSNFTIVILLSILLSPSGQANDSLTENEKNTIKIFSESVDSVVNITNIKHAMTWEYGEVDIPAGAGSGFVWDANGHIVTNFHVVDGGDTFMITFRGDQKQYKAKIVGGVPERDVAVLKLIDKKGGLKPLTVGHSQTLRVGQKAIAIGNPFGLDHTITEGIISAKDRKIDGYGGIKIHGMIQTDCSINPGNSGGPLINSSGELIGMNTIIFSKSGTSSGVGFAVPVEIINRIVPQLIQHGKIIRPGLGIGILPDQYKERFGIEKGLVITYVDEKGPVGKIGLKGMEKDRFGRNYLGDIILAIDDKELNSYDDVYNALEKYKANDEVKITYLRDKKILEAKVKLTSIDK